MHIYIYMYMYVYVYIYIYILSTGHGFLTGHPPSSLLRHPLCAGAAAAAEMALAGAASNTTLPTKMPQHETSKPGPKNMSITTFVLDSFEKFWAIPLRTLAVQVDAVGIF